MFIFLTKIQTLQKGLEIKNLKLYSTPELAPKREGVRLFCPKDVNGGSNCGSKNWQLINDSPPDNRVWRDTFHTDILCHEKTSIRDLLNKHEKDQCGVEKNIFSRNETSKIARLCELEKICPWKTTLHYTFTFPAH